MRGRVATPHADRTDATQRGIPARRRVKITKFPVVFDSDSVDLGGFIETIAPSAVDRTLRNSSEVVALVNHNSDMPLGRRSAHTLALAKRDRGLQAIIDVDEGVTFAADFLRILDRGDAPGGSFA